MRHRIWHLTCPQLQEGRPPHGAPQKNFVMGSSTLWARPSPPHKFMAIPKYPQVAPYMDGRKNSKDPLWIMRRSWRGVSSSENSRCRGRTVFMIFMLWILKPPHNSSKNPRSSWKFLIRRRRRIILTPASKSVVTSLSSSPHWTGFSVSRHRRHFNLLPSASRQSGKNPTHVPAGTWRVELR